MKLLLLASLLTLGLAASATAEPVHLHQYAGGFQTESAPNDNTIIVKEGGANVNEGGVVAAIKNGSWVTYKDFAFVNGASHFTIEASAETTGGGTIELRTGTTPSGGTLLGQVAITSTGGVGKFQLFSCPISPMAGGKSGLILKFSGAGTGDLFKIRNFRFTHDDEVRVTGLFTGESHPASSTTVYKSGDEVKGISDGTWISFGGVTYPTGVDQVQIEAATPNSGGTIKLRSGSSTGPVHATVTVTNTGGYGAGAYRSFVAPLTTPLPAGSVVLYMTFERASGSTASSIFNTRYFRLTKSTAPVLRVPDNPISASSYDSKTDVSGATISKSGFKVGNIKDGASLTFNNVDFGTDTNTFEVEVASLKRPGKIEIRLGSATGTLIGSIDAFYTGSYTYFRRFATFLNQTVSGVQTVHLKFVGPTAGASNLMDVRSFCYWSTPAPAAPLPAGTLSVYPSPVPETTVPRPDFMSPYYDIYVQKESAFGGCPPENAPASSWQKPFAWFTQCVDNSATHGTSYNSAYYAAFIGGWSHTYCNFEMTPGTPIIVKIVRKGNQGDGAPFGPITSSAARPLSRLDAVPQVIGGAVYLRLSNPALIAVDIDGQLDGRNAPRATETGWGATAFPYSTRAAGAHGLTIFANPVLQNKPAPPPTPAFSGQHTNGVYYVQPGAPIPRTGTWTTLYFKPGIHKLSVNPDGNERPWLPSDSYTMENNKSYYLPGDAIVYGNFSDAVDPGLPSPSRSNIRFFGHGTLSGKKIPHPQDFQSSDTTLVEWNPKVANNTGRWVLKSTLERKARMIQLDVAENCRYEGLTIADPAHHGVYFRGVDEPEKGNSMSWLKNISWRVNNDGAGVSGNSTVEDCFFRHQDDGLYVQGVGIRRCVFWSDVNGTTLRCSFIHNNRGRDYPSALPQDLVVEDCEVVYTRHAFSVDPSNPHGIIGAPGGPGDAGVFGDGTNCMGQHVIFRNILVSDPKPIRVLFGFKADGDLSLGNNLETPWAGLRFHDVCQQWPQTFKGTSSNWRHALRGGSTAGGGMDAAKIQWWTLQGVYLQWGSNGEIQNLMDAADVSNTSLFDTLNVSNMTYLP